MATPAKRKAVEIQQRAPLPRPAPCADDDFLMKLRRENEQLKCFAKKVFTEGKIDSQVLPEEFQKEIEPAVRNFVILHIQHDSHSDWLELPQKWKDDVEVACAMYELGNRVQCKHVPKWNELPYHLLTNQRVLVHAFQRWDGPRYKEIPWWMRDNPDVMLAAFKSRKLSHLPEQLKRDHRETALHCIKKGQITVDECTCFDDNILRELVEKGELDWSMLPPRLKTNLDFAMSLSKFPANDIQAEILQNVPDARKDKSFWRHFILLSKEIGIDRSLGEFLPPNISSDWDFMLDMCCENYSVLGLVPSLLADKAFLKPILARNIEALYFVPRATQVLFPELIWDAIPSISQSDSSYELGDCVDLSFFEDRAFALAWFSAGLYRVNSDDHTEPDSFSRYKEDGEIALAYLKHSSFDVSRDVSPALLQERDFVLKAVRVHPPLFHRIDPHLRLDHFVFTKFAAHSYKFTRELLVDMHFRRNDAAILSHLGFIRLELNKYKVFFLFICGATINRSDSALSKFNQGPETFLVFKKLLTEFLQVPTGEWLQDLRRAEQHVSKAILPWTSDA